MHIILAQLMINRAMIKSKEKKYKININRGLWAPQQRQYT